MIESILSTTTPAYFTANNAVASVLINTPPADSSLGIKSAGVDIYKYFRPDDGVLIKGVSIILPYQYTFGAAPVSISLEAQVAGFGAVFFPQISDSTNGRINIPSENFFIPLNIFIPPPYVSCLAANPGLPATAKWYLAAIPDAVISVSQIGGPAILNAVQLPVNVMLHVAHSYPLTVTA